MSTDYKTLKSLQLSERSHKLAERIALFNEYKATQQTTYLRNVVSAAGREVIVKDPFTGRLRNMLMFASNNYLGLGNHPHVKSRIKNAMNEYGCGIGGPPLLNGYLKLTQEAEERLAALKSDESAMLFSSGFLANLAVISALAQQGDVIIYDEYSHASFCDGIKLTRAKAVAFVHNDLENLSHLLSQYAAQTEGTLFVCVEGVYSMDGDIAPLNKISAICKSYSAQLIVDDAHGTGILGEHGGGTASHLKCSKDIDITMGTFSKAFATCGGFLSGNKAMIEYLRFHARPYIFSASIPPPVIAAVLGGLEVMEKEPWLKTQVLENTTYAAEKLKAFEFCAPPQAAIIALALPPKMDIRKAALLFHQKNIFINAVEYPAVPANHQRFRISLMATHTKEDIDRLATAFEEVWADLSIYRS